MKRREVTDAPIAGVNIVPVIDLCLVLLVILLILSPLMDHPPLEVQLPKAKTTEEKENNITLTVSPEGKMALNSELVNKFQMPQFLRLMLKEQGDDVLVVIRAHQKVRYQDLTDLLKTVKNAGAKKISLGTDQGKEGS